MRRRTFLKAAALAPAVSSRPVWAADAEIELRPGSPGPVIAPDLYGHFIEHLGGVIYDGIWVGRGSKIPNVNGIRKEFIDSMKGLGAPNLRWPGGCFADGYHWRDGIGPASKRPRTYNYWQRDMPAGLQATESNQFGFHEFMDLCRLTGAKPYLAANVGSGSPREFHDWVAYCNAPAGSITLADERAANGAKDPFNVDYWGVGNESWGCGGTMRAEEYAAKYRQFITQFPAYRRPFLIATGPRGHSANEDIPWTSGFFEGMRGFPPPNGFSVHYYTDLRPTRFKPAEFNAVEWYEVLLRGLRLDKVLADHWAEMGKFDANHRTKLVVDEWGVWYPPGSEIAPADILSQPLTLRDAVHTGLTFDIFNRHADKLAMANVAQTVNCIHNLFLAREDKFVRTPVFHVFEMYRRHAGARQVPIAIHVPDQDITALAGPAKLPGLSGSASLRERLLAVSLTNPSLESAVAARIQFADGARPAEARATILTHADMQAGNTFAHPDEVKPEPFALKISGGVIEVSIPKQSVLAIEARLV